MLEACRIDPAGCCPRNLVATATSADELWPGQPTPCIKTIRLARVLMAKWSPSTHWRHHAGVQEAVCTVLLVSVWLDALGHRRRRSARQGQALPGMPAELWAVTGGPWCWASCFGATSLSLHSVAFPPRRSHQCQ